MKKKRGLFQTFKLSVVSTDANTVSLKNDLDVTAHSNADDEHIMNHFDIKTVPPVARIQFR